MSEEPAPPASVERAGQAHGLECETAGLFPKPEQRPVPVFGLMRLGSHAFVAGGLKMSDS